MKSDTTRLHLIRHGEVEEKYHRIFGGKIDMNLSATGQDQAEILSRYLRKHPITGAYASPMRRVQQTFSPYVKQGGQTPITMSDLREVDFGDWTGLGWQEINQRFNLSAFDWLEHLEEGTIPNAESAQDYQNRIQPCLRQILAEHPGSEVAVFCHGGVIRQLLALMLEMPLRKMSMFEVDYASTTVIDWAPGRVEIQLLNFAPWRHA